MNLYAIKYDSSKPGFNFINFVTGIVAGYRAKSWGFFARIALRDRASIASNIGIVLAPASDIFIDRMKEKSIGFLFCAYWIGAEVRFSLIHGDQDKDVVRVIEEAKAGTLKTVPLSVAGDGKVSVDVSPPSEAGIVSTDWQDKQ